jgi:hypothetical protein
MSMKQPFFEKKHLPLRFCLESIFAHLIVPLNYFRKYFRSGTKRKINFSFVFRSLNRTFELFLESTFVREQKEK